MMRRLLPLLCVLLAACAPGQPGGALQADALGLAGVHSRQVVISDHPHHVILGHVIIARQGGDVSRALILSHQWDGVHRLRVTGAWNGGRTLPVRPLPRNDGCTRATCRNGPIGMILLDGPAVAAAAESGLTARLHTNAGPVAVTVPPRLFAEAMARDIAP